MADMEKIKFAQTIRDSVHNLVISEENEVENEVYYQKVKSFMVLLEGYRNEAYIDGILDPDALKKKIWKYISVKKFKTLDQDTQNLLEENARQEIVTVGIGANINFPKFRKTYDKLLGIPGLMQRVYDGEVNLTDDQVDKIFRESIRIRLDELRNIYGADWDKLRANERMAIISLYFNFPGLVNEGTIFRKQMGKYVDTNDVQCLCAAVKEVRENSNPENNEGLQNRRDAEAELLSSHKCPAYTKPHESPDAVKVREAHLNSTIMPINCDPLCSEQGVNEDYFVWRTQMDHKVREDHLAHEGKIFRRDNPPDCLPGETYNCRCRAEDVPDEVYVHDDEAYRRAFELYIRKGIRDARLTRRPNPLPQLSV